jgi:hypothetical protein
MDRMEYLGVKEAAQVKGVKPKTLHRWLERKRITLANDAEDGRKRLLPISALSPGEREAWQKTQISLALQAAGQDVQDGSGMEEHSQAIDRLQPTLQFAPPSPSEAARDAVVAGIPHRHRAYVERWMFETSENVNGTWKLKRGMVENGRLILAHRDYVRARAALLDVAVSTYDGKLKIARQILADPAIPKANKWRAIAESFVPKPRPGRSGHSYFADPSEEVAWQFPALRGFYLNQAQLSIKAAHRLLLDLIEKKQRAWGLGCLYPRPTLAQSRTALAKIPLPERTLGRQGEEEYQNRCSPWIKRRPPGESGAVVGTDGKLLDILCRDAGWRVGRIWWVPFADVAAERWLGHAFGPTISGDMVMDAAAMMLEETCVPGSVQIDRGKQFQGNRFTGGFFKISAEKVFEEMEGLWERLGVRVLSATGRNPQTKPIERLFRSVREFEQSWSTYTGPNPQERPPQLALIEKQVEEFKAGKAPAPAVPTIDQVIAGLVWWCKYRWNAQHRGRGKYRHGATPDEMWNIKRPAAGFRTLTESELEYYTADRRFLKIGRGGQVNLSIYGQTVEYTAPELFLHQGEEAEVLVSRRTVDQVTVIYPVVGGTESCIARLKEEVPWGSESRAEVKVRLRCINSVKRILKRNLRTVDTAEGVLAEAPFLPTRALLDTLAAQQIVNPRQLFGTSAPAPPPLGHPETASVEYLSQKLARHEKPRFASDLADRALELERE